MASNINEAGCSSTESGNDAGMGNPQVEHGREGKQANDDKLHDNSDIKKTNSIGSIDNNLSILKINSLNKNDSVPNKGTNPSKVSGVASDRAASAASVKASATDVQSKESNNFSEKQVAVNNHQEEQDRLDAALALASIIQVATPPSTPAVSPRLTPPISASLTHSTSLTTASSRPLTVSLPHHTVLSRGTSPSTSSPLHERVPSYPSIKDADKSKNVKSLFANEKPSKKVYAIIPSTTSGSQPTYTKIKKLSAEANKSRRVDSTRTTLPQVCLPKINLSYNRQQSESPKSINLIQKPVTSSSGKATTTLPSTTLPPSSLADLIVANANSKSFHQNLILSEMMKSPTFVQHYQTFLQNTNKNTENLNSQPQDNSMSVSDVSPIVISPSPDIEEPLDLSKEQQEPLDLKVRRLSNNSLEKQNSESLKNNTNVQTRRGESPIDSNTHSGSSKVKPIMIRSLRTATNVGLLESNGASPMTTNQNSVHQSGCIASTPNQAIQSSLSIEPSPEMQIPHLIAITEFNKEDQSSEQSTSDRKLPPKKRRIYGSDNSDQLPASEEETNRSNIPAIAKTKVTNTSQIPSEVMKIASLECDSKTSNSLKRSRRSNSIGSAKEMSPNGCVTVGDSSRLVCAVGGVKSAAAVGSGSSTVPRQVASLPPVTARVSAGSSSTGRVLAVRASAAASLRPPRSVMLPGGHAAVRPDEDGDIPLHVAVVQGEVEVVERLIAFMVATGHSLNIQNNLRQTPLHLAVLCEQEVLVHALVRAGALPGVPDRAGRTALHVAVRNRSAAVLRMLLASASPADLDTKNYDGMTALHMAVLADDPEIVTMLIEAGANIDIQDGKSGRTALFHAAESSGRNHYRIASVLLQQGAEVSVPSYSGSLAVQAANGRGRSEMVALLIKYGADGGGGARGDAADTGGSSAKPRGRGSKAALLARQAKTEGKSMVMQMLRNNIQSKDDNGSAVNRIHSPDIIMHDVSNDSEASHSASQEQTSKTEKVREPLTIPIPKHVNTSS